MACDAISYLLTNLQPSFPQQNLRAVVTQLQQHMSNHKLYELLQSGFRIRHTSETAFIKITNDLLIAADADNDHISILILLDLSAALTPFLTPSFFHVYWPLWYSTLLVSTPPLPQLTTVCLKVLYLDPISAAIVSACIPMLLKQLYFSTKPSPQLP